MSNTTAESELRALCTWAAGLASADIPRAILDRAAVVMADDVACAIAAESEPEVAALSGEVRQSPTANEAALWTPLPQRADRIGAAMHNAIRANWIQLDEGHRSVMCHAGLYCVPTALAEAQAEGRSISETLRAIVLGYEITCRLARAWRFGAVVPHPHAVWSACGAFATLAVLRRHDAPRLIAGLNAASTLAMAAPFTHVASGALVANAWVGAGVANGFHCASWLCAGISGTPPAAQVFEGLLGASFEPGVLCTNLGAQWALQNNYHKIFACGQQTTAALEAMLDLRSRASKEQLRVPVSAIEADVHAFALTLADRAPTTSLGARFSLPHLLASAWVHGRSDPWALGGMALQDAQVARLRERVVLRAHHQPLAPPHDRAARVQVRLEDGLTLHAECLSARGGPDRPLSRAEVLEKCRTLAGNAMSPLFDLVERLPSIRPEELEGPLAGYLPRR
jgi:2-methylcitrate dehydratase PrpD